MPLLGAPPILYHVARFSGFISTRGQPFKGRRRRGGDEGFTVDARSSLRATRGDSDDF